MSRRPRIFPIDGERIGASASAVVDAFTVEEIRKHVAFLEKNDISHDPEKLKALWPPGRSDTASNGSSVRSSKRRDVLDEIPTAVRKKPTAKKPPNFAKALADSTTYGEQIIKGDWEPRDERDLVGLYAALHRHVYGVDALELRAELGAARASCGKLLRDEFKGDPIALQTYLAWAMKRARDWKRSKERDGEEVVRVGWRLVFKNRKWLVDFLASQGHREASRPSG